MNFEDYCLQGKDWTMNIFVRGAAVMGMLASVGTAQAQTTAPIGPQGSWYDRVDEIERNEGRATRDNILKQCEEMMVANKAKDMNDCLDQLGR